MLKGKKGRRVHTNIHAKDCLSEPESENRNYPMSKPLCGTIRVLSPVAWTDRPSNEHNADSLKEIGGSTEVRVIRVTNFFTIRFSSPVSAD